MPGRTQSQSRRSGRRGFAAMDPDKQRRIASMGGRASHGGRDYEEEDEERPSRRGRSGGGSRRGFAGMDPEEQRETSSRGGRASHSGGRRSEYDEDDYESESESRRGRGGGSRRGFAAMDPEERREISARGGRSRSGRNEDYEEDYDDDDFEDDDRH